MTFFFISFVVSIFVLYIIGRVWFAGSRSAYLVIFFTFGVLVSIWTFLNGLSGIVAPQHIRVLEPIWMVPVCCIPFLLLHYVLYFVHSPLAGNKYLLRLSAFLMFADVAILLTNPWHMLFYESFTESGRGVYGPFYWVHSCVSYAVLAVGLIMLIVYTVKNYRRQPYLIGFLVGIPWPFVLNLLYVFGPFGSDYDLTPLGFGIMFFTFGFFSIRLRLFNLKSTASVNIFDTLAEGFVIVNNIGLIDDVNTAFRNAFPVEIEPETTPIKELVDYMQSVAVQYKPDNIFDCMASSTQEIEEGELSIPDGDGDIRTFAVQKDFITLRGQAAGYILTLVDVSLYRRIMDRNDALLLDIRTASEQMAVISQQISSVSQSIAEGAGKQESGISQFSNSIVHMKDMVEKTADTARQATGEMTRAEEKMTESYTFMKQLGEAIHAINESARSTNAVIKTIDSIAFQTNILAINASIEAAHAGQHGKGFAVVAEEVRSLALNVARSAKDSSELIDDCSKRAQEGAEIMQKASESMALVRELAGQNAQTIAQITEATQVQAKEIAAINEGIQDISHVTSHNASIALQWASSSEEMSIHSAKLRNISARLQLREDA